MIGSEVGVGVAVGIAVAVGVGVDAAGVSLMRGKMQPDKPTIRSEAIASSAAVRPRRPSRRAGEVSPVAERMGT